MQKFYLGKVVKPQGVKGELKIMPNVNNQNMIEDVKQIYFNNDNEAMDVVKIVYRLGFVYLTIKGIDDRNKAENYRNFKVYTLKSDIKTKQDEFLTEDLIGLNVFDEDNVLIGTILEIENYGANDIVTILEDKREYSVAFLKNIFVSITKQRIILNRKKYDEAKLCE